MVTFSNIMFILIAIIVIALTCSVIFDLKSMTVNSNSYEERVNLQKKWNKPVFFSFTIAVTAFVIAICFFVWWTVSDFKGEYKHVDTMKIVALQDSTIPQVKGSRFSIRSEDYVRVCYEQPNGAKKILKFPTDSVTFYEQNIDNPRVERWTYQYNSEFVNRSKDFHPSKYNIYIPKGSVVEDFNVDLK